MDEPTPDAAEIWPQIGVHLTAGDLQLRVVRDDDAIALGAILHTLLPPDRQHHLGRAYQAVTDDPTTTTRNVLTYHWKVRSATTPQRWQLPFAVIRDGVVLGTQSLFAIDFPQLRLVTTGSFLASEHRGQGVGTAARAAVLDLAFDHLGARTAGSGYVIGNAASAAVSYRLGYRDDGVEEDTFRGRPLTRQRVRLPRSQWERARPDNMPTTTVTGMGPLLAMLGLSAAPQGPDPTEAP